MVGDTMTIADVKLYTIVKRFQDYHAKYSKENKGIEDTEQQNRDATKFLNDLLETYKNVASNYAKVKTAVGALK